MDKYFISKKELGNLLDGFSTYMKNKFFREIHQQDIEKLKKMGKILPAKSYVTTDSARKYLKSYGIEL